MIVELSCLSRGTAAVFDSWHPALLTHGTSLAMHPQPAARSTFH